MRNESSGPRSTWPTTTNHPTARPVVFPNLKPSSQPVSIRFPVSVLDALKERANKMGVPYHALIKEAVVEYLSKGT